MNYLRILGISISLLFFFSCGETASTDANSSETSTEDAKKQGTEDTPVATFQQVEKTVMDISLKGRTAVTKAKTRMPTLVDKEKAPIQAYVTNIEAKTDALRVKIKEQISNLKLNETKGSDTFNQDLALIRSEAEVLKKTIEQLEARLK